ncbi:hypothetical protein OAZ24_00560 [Synechococcus sp. AH-736-G21]|nr:hypothetical protein [Synechococcus sp. AH-736-G21]
MLRTHKPTLTTRFLRRGIGGVVLFGMGWSLAVTVAKLERCQRTPMPIPWGDHLAWPGVWR